MTNALSITNLVSIQRQKGSKEIYLESASPKKSGDECRHLSKAGSRQLSKYFFSFFRNVKSTIKVTSTDVIKEKSGSTKKKKKKIHKIQQLLSKKKFERKVSVFQVLAFQPCKGY